MRYLLLLLCLNFAISANAQEMNIKLSEDGVEASFNENKNKDQRFNQWAFQLQWVKQNYFRDDLRLIYLSPSFGENGDAGKIGAYLHLREMMAYEDKGIYEYGVYYFVEGWRKNLISSNIQLGAALVSPDSSLYDGTFVNANFAFGVAINTSNERNASAFTINYEFTIVSSYDIDKSLPDSSSNSVKKDSWTDGRLMLGLRVHY